MLVPKSFEHLVKFFQILPGVGERTAERFAYAIEKKDLEEITGFADSLIDFKKNIRYCSICNCLSDSDICPICSDENRNNGIICIVEDSKTAFSIDKTNKYNGRFYILNGLISPSDGVNPEDLYLDKLLDTISGYKEVILALNPSIEGEITSLYIQKKLFSTGVKISRLSYGVPMGSEIEYLDPLMISKALDDRKFLS